MFDTVIMESPISQHLPSASPAAHHRHRLDQLRAGTHGVVRHIESNSPAMHRLMSMGLCVGREFEVVRHGNPLIIRFLGARVGVSDRLARHILVEHRS